MNGILQEVAANWVVVAAWGLVATAVMTSVLEGAQLFGFSRLSLPFLFGTFVVSNRRRAMIFGYLLYLVGGWLFAFFYALLFSALATSEWWVGALLGIAHGLFLVAVFLPTLPMIHPRMATEYDAPGPGQRLEPPGAFGLHYGKLTPIATVASQTVYGCIMALAYPA